MAIGRKPSRPARVSAPTRLYYRHCGRHLLQLDGRPLTAGTRRFWGFRDPWVRDYLTQRVIHFLREHGFGYLKVDYNESVGLGADGVESLGESLRTHLLDAQGFFRAIREALPDLVIENCASGGHRLEPSFLEICPLASSSDAHECLEVPIIAADQTTQLLPEQNLIWAVVRKGDDEQRLAYTLSACFLGRLCLSGDVSELNDERWNFVQAALRLYLVAVPAIRDGTIRRHGQVSPSYRHPRGWQGVTFETPELVVAVIHTFADAPEEMPTLLPAGDWQIEATFAAAGAAEVEVRDGFLCLGKAGDFTGRVIILRPALPA